MKVQLFGSSCTLKTTGAGKKEKLLVIADPVFDASNEWLRGRGRMSGRPATNTLSFGCPSSLSGKDDIIWLSVRKKVFNTFDQKRMG